MLPTSPRQLFYCRYYSTDERSGLTVAAILPGYSFDRSAAQFRSSATGQFVSRERITGLLDTQIRGAEDRLGGIISAVHEGAMSPGYGQVVIRDELRRLHLQNAALGAGGFDRLTFREYGRAGRLLREDYARMTRLINEVKAGKVTLPQALQRVHGYVGSARVNFLEAERDAARNSGRPFEERRRLNANESCADCVRYAGMGWQPIGVLPIPGNASRCKSNCRCALERREVTPEMTRERMTQQLERMMA